MHATIIEIDTRQFINNLKAIRDKVGSTKICLPVKANAYGHGLVKMAQLAQEHVDYLAVACLQEGAALRQNHITKPILVFGAFNQEEVPGFIANNLEITISSVLKAAQVADYCRHTGQQAKIHVKIDTGMNRVGVRPETAPQLFNFIREHRELILVGVYSHLSSADENETAVTLDQINKFTAISVMAKQINPQVICHLANSAGLCYYPQSWFDMVRPGILSFGYFPNRTINEEPWLRIQPCFSLKSRIIYTKTVEKGRGISYNHRYTTQEQTRIVTLPIGYGDGYPRMLSNIGDVLIHGKKYPIAGTICMDMLMVDIGPEGQAKVGDSAVLIGTQGTQHISVESVAGKCQTIIYEILCGFNDRIPRIYI